MKAPGIVFYISGHGFGHARRSAQVIAELAKMRPDLTIHIRTHAPARLFERVLSDRVMHHLVHLDPGCVERDVFTIDPQRTIAALAEALENREKGVESELSFIRGRDVRLILSDIPFVAADIAAMAGIECIGISNFTWDWLYEPFAAARLVEEVRRSYSRMTCLFKMPIGGACPLIQDVTEIAHIGSRPQLGPEQVLDELELSDDARPRVLVGLRGGVSPQALNTAARSCPDLVFVTQESLGGECPENVRRFDTGGAMQFVEVMSVCDVVVSKLGYGINADCLAMETALLWPRRTGFREDELSERILPQHLRMRELPLEDLYSGRWASHLHALLEMSQPAATVPTDGDVQAARLIAEKFLDARPSTPRRI